MMTGQDSYIGPRGSRARVPLDAPRPARGNTPAGCWLHCVLGLACLRPLAEGRTIEPAPSWPAPWPPFPPMIVDMGAEYTGPATTPQCWPVQTSARVTRRSQHQGRRLTASGLVRGRRPGRLETLYYGSATKATPPAGPIRARRDREAIRIVLGRIPPFCGYFIKMGELLLTRTGKCG